MNASERQDLEVLLALLATEEGNEAEAAQWALEELLYRTWSRFVLFSGPNGRQGRRGAPEKRTNSNRVHWFCRREVHS